MKARFVFAAACVASCLALLTLNTKAQTAAPAVIAIDARGAAKPFPHFWERMFGSGRAILSLRESYRQDLRATKEATDLEYIRFHNILSDENGVYSEDQKGKPQYNFAYVDQIYDGLLANHVRPFVELSFMPSALASSQTPHAFWYKPLPNPPRDYAKWGELIRQFTIHLEERYGAAEVRNWYFEVWNEPNIDFWTGDPKQATYFQLYGAAAKAVKAVDANLRVGGPATAQAAWIPEFIRHCVDRNIPVDFVSTHVYGNDRAEDVFGTHETIPRSDMVAKSVKKVYDQVKASTRPALPIFWTEYNASYMNEVEVTDSAYMGPWLANNIRMSDGMTSMMSYWSFSDVFEEQGVVKKPFYGGYGLIAAGGIPKAAFNAFTLLHHLGSERINVNSDAVLATRHSNGRLAIAVWNYSPPEKLGPQQDFDLALTGPSAKVTIIDEINGSALPAWKAMGSPASPTQMQLQRLKAAAKLPEAKTMPITGGHLRLSLPAHALALVEIPGNQ